ncbi:MAG: efflux transporter outer membrane subunit [Beijerinckiaceae bacterium]
MKLLQYVGLKGDPGTRGVAGKLAGALGLLTCASILSACTVGPNYSQPSAPVPAVFKERQGWHIAKPIDTLDRGAWWRVFNDPKLDELMPQVAISNQNVAAAEAAYRQAVAVIREAQAGFFPTVTNSYSATRSHSGAAVSATGFSTTTMTYNPVANATWDLDVWGRIRRTVESDAAAAQVSAADLANATLSAQAALATAYFNMRATESLKALYERTTVAYQRTLKITKDQKEIGYTNISRADVASALAQVLNVQAQAIGTDVARAQFEHAIAILIGRPPAELNLARGRLASSIPNEPVMVPSALLERRPDIAAAERQMQQYNALVGVAVANFYPDISLSGSFGFIGPHALPISAANEVWSIAATATQPVFDGGLLSADLEAAKAAYQQNVANYRQTVLTAFQQVEDELAAVRIYPLELRKEDQAVKAAREAVEVYLNQYQQGTVVFTTVATAQETQLADEVTALMVRQNLFIADVALIEALGGGWDKSRLPGLEDLSKLPTLTPPL